jgi:flagellar motor switch protein FliM
MQRAGLAALADTYGLEPLELHQLQLLGKRFFDQLGEDLMRYTTSPIKVVEVGQNLESFEQFCKRPRTQYICSLGYDNEAALAFRVERGMPRTIVDALLGVRAHAPLARVEDGGGALSATESRLFLRILGRTVTAALDRVFGRLLGDRGSVELLLSVDHPAFGPRTFDASEQLVTLQARCRLNDVSGCFTLGLPLSLLLQIRTRLVPRILTGANHNLHKPNSTTALANALVEMQALLGQRMMPFSQLSRLKVGSVVLLQKLDRDLPKVELRAAGQLLFRGTVVDDRGWHNFLIQQIGDADGKRATE